MTDKQTISIPLPDAFDPEQYKFAWNKYRTYRPADLIALTGIIQANIMQHKGDIRMHSRIAAWELAADVMSRIIEMHMSPLASPVIPELLAQKKEPEIITTEA